jgi:putative peptidoglycan lipid II flippase
METQRKATVVRAAGLLMASTVLSRVLGYFRDILIAAAYGQTRVTDAYIAAFSIPDFLYNLLVAGTATAAFIPVFSGYIATGRQDEGWEVASTVYNIAAAAMLCGIIAASALAPAIVAKLVPGFEPESMALTVRMTRIMLAQAFFMALNGISAGILNSYQRFLGPAIASVMYNVMIVLCGAALHKRLGIVGFSVGVVAGAAAQFLVLIANLKGIGMRYMPILRWRHPGVRRVFVLMVPILLSYTLTQIGLFVQQNMSSSLPGGALAALRWAQRLMQMPVSVFAVTMVIAIFPTLNGEIARNEMEAFKKSFVFGLRSIIYITLPCGVGLAALGRPVVRLLYQQGNFNAENTVLTAYTLTFFCLGLFAQGGVLLMNRVFYALQNTWTPVLIGACAMLFNILLNYMLVGVMGTGGLALAYSLAGVLNLVFLLYMVRRSIGRIGGRRLAASFGKTLFMSAAMGVAVYAVAWLAEAYLVDIHTKAGQAIQVGGAVAAGGLVYFGLSILLKMEETGMVKNMVKRKKRPA